MLELPIALGVEPVALQRRQTSTHLAYFGIGMQGILCKDVKDSKELAPEFEMYG